MIIRRTMRRLTWWAQRLALRLGWPGVAGVVLLLGCGAVHWGVLVKEAARQNGLRTAFAALASTLKTRQDQPVMPDNADLLAQFYRALPLSTTDQRTDVLARMQAAALAEGLVLEQASYLLNAAAETPFDGLDIVLPVKGSYRQLRRFMARAQSETPALALEAVSLNRQAVGDAAIEAQLRFSLYLQKP